MPGIEIYKTEGGALKVRTRGEMNFSQVSTLLFNAVLHMMRVAEKSQPTRDYKEFVYETVNAHAAAVLEAFGPEFGNNLTERAIMEAENAIIERELSALQEPVGTE